MDAISVLGLSLVLCIFVSKILSRFSIPKVTIYLVIGIALGPSLFNLANDEIVDSLQIIEQVAFGLILFNIGGAFHKELFSKLAMRHLRFVSLFSLLTMIGVSLFMFVGATIFTDFTTIECIALAVFMGIIALDAAPSTTSLVLKEYDAEGPLTHMVYIFLATSALFTLIFSEAAVGIFASLGVIPILGTTSIPLALVLVYKIVMPFLVGMILGFVLSIVEQYEPKKSETLFIVSAFILIGFSLSNILKIEPLLVSLFLGFSLVNTSTSGEVIHHQIKDMGITVYALFFVLVGAKIDIVHKMHLAGPIALVYIIARVSSFVLSAFISKKIVKEEDVIGKFFGVSILPHAGVALAVAQVHAGYGHPIGDMVSSAVVFAVLPFELFGPIILRSILKVTGEMKKSVSKIKSTKQITLSPLELLKNFKSNLLAIKNDGIDYLDLNKYLERQVTVIKSTASVQEAISHIEHQKAQFYVVVDEDNTYLGIVDLKMVLKVNKDALVKDYIEELSAVCTTDSIFNIVQGFDDIAFNCRPVVTDGKFVGLVFYRDLLLALSK